MTDTLWTLTADQPPPRELADDEWLAVVWSELVEPEFVRWDSVAGEWMNTKRVCIGRRKPTHWRIVKMPGAGE